MSGIATLGSAAVDQAAGSIAIPMVATIGVIVLAHWLFDVVPAANALAGAGNQRRMASATGNRPAANHTPLAHSTFDLTWLSNPTRACDTAHPLRRECG
jgi:hypothetical protein